MKHRVRHLLGIQLTLLCLLVSVCSGTPAAASSRGEKNPVPAGDAVVSSPAKPALPYAEYVRLVSRRGVAGHGHARKKTVKTAKVSRAARKGDKEKVSEKAAAAPTVAATTAAMPVESKRSGGWRPGPDEVREVLRSTRDLSGANLRGMNLAGLDLRNASLANADLYLANLAGARLDGANLRGTSLEMANLRGASLKGAKLAGAGLFMTNLEGADLERADLTGVYAVGANLRGAVLASAILRGGLFTNAVMERGAPGDESVVAEGDREGEAGTVRRVKATSDGASQTETGRFAFLKF